MFPSSTSACHPFLRDFFTFFGQPYQRQCDDEVDDEHHQVGHRTFGKVRRTVNITVVEYICETDQGYECGPFEYLYGIVAELRQHQPECLRQDDVPHALHRAQVQCDGCLRLPSVHSEDRSPDDLRHVGAVVQTDGDHTDDPVASEMDVKQYRHCIVQPEQLDDERRAPEHFHIKCSNAPHDGILHHS